MSICIRDALLIKYNIFIDEFSTNDGFHFLTHAHQDHMVGLTKTFTTTIYTSKITRDLVMLQKPKFTKSRFIIVKKRHELLPNVFVTTMDSNHCIGSVMFLFEIEHQKVLYTGDFKWHQDMNSNRNILFLDKIYFDDTLFSMNYNGLYPSKQDTFETMLATILKIRKSDQNAKIFINSQILGLEEILVKLSLFLKEQFMISDGLIGNFRSLQLNYLLGKYITSEQDITSNSNLVLANKSLDDTKKNQWIFPTSLHFLCLDKNPNFKDIPKNHHYVWLCTHANKEDVEHLKRVTNAKEVIGCQYSIANLKCIKKN